MADVNIRKPNRTYNDWTMIEKQIIELQERINEIIVGSVDYNEAINKPSLNGETIQGNKQSADYLLVDNIDTDIDENNNLYISIKSGENTIADTSINIPTASVVSDVYLDNVTGDIVIIFTNGQELRIPVSNFIKDMLPYNIDVSLSSANWGAQTGQVDIYEQDITTYINYILAQIPLYNKVIPEGTENPSEEGWYELDQQGQYTLTQDTSIVEGKEYYRRVYKAITENTKFDIAIDETNQHLLNTSNIKNLYITTYSESGTAKAKAIAVVKDGSTFNPSSFTISTTLTNIINLIQGASINSNVLYGVIEKDIQATDPTDNDNVSEVDGNVNKVWSFARVWNYIKGKISSVFYPIGTVIFNTGTNPSTAYGGTWELYADGTKALYLNATAGTTVNEELPNLKLEVNDIYLKGDRRTPKTTPGTTLSIVNNNWGGTNSGNATNLQSLKFNANGYNSVYKDNGKVRAEGITICAWVRTA